MARWQYQGKVEPFTEALPVVTTNTAWIQPASDPIRVAASPSRYGFTAWVPQHTDAEGSDLGWTPRYPDTIFRLTVRAVDHPAFSAGTFASTLPIPETSWTPIYPDRIWRTTLSTGAIPTLFVEPFPRPGATQLSAWAFYPDQIDRRTTHPALMPYHVPGPLEPIPNPPIVGILDDKFHLGTKESLGVTQQPTLGGWQAW